MRMVAWFNLSAAAFCALQAIQGNAPDFNAWFCAGNILCAGFNFGFSRSNAKVDAPSGATAERR